MFVLEGNIVIGNYRFNAIHDVEITKSVDELVDTAVIKLPTKFKVRGTDNINLRTEEAIKVGDEVTITLGYQDEYSGVEFKGYVSRIRPTFPVEIQCEDAMYLLRRKNINRVWTEPTTIKEVLEEIVKDTPIQLADNIPVTELDGYVIKNGNGTQELQRIKKDFPFGVFMDDENKLFCNLREFINVGKDVIYDLNYNIVENNLEFKTKEERKIRVNYIYTAKDGTKKEVFVGDTSGELRTFNTSTISNEEDLKKFAQAKIDLLKFDGFEGDVKSFLIPFATRGMKAIIKDQDHKNREGSYFINKVVTTFGTGGARRIVTIGNKL